MTSKKRSRKSTTSSTVPSPFRSKLEARVAADLGRQWEYEKKEEMVSYQLTFDYLPDFSMESKLGYTYLVEVKGYFRPGDIKKYAGVAKALREQDNKELVFVFADPFKPVRKGAKLTMAGWAEKHGCAWFHANALSELKRYAK